jgi:hypothetical protein
VLQNDASVYAGSVAVVAGADGPTVARIAAVGDKGAKINFTHVNLDGNALSLVGGVTATVGNVVGDRVASFIQSSNATLDSGVINVPIKVLPDGDQPAILNVKGRVETKEIVGGGTVNVTGGSQLKTNETVEAKLHVDGEVVFGNTTVKGSIDITSNGVLRITPSDPTSVPHLDAFQNCQGIIYFHIDGSCDASRKGTLWTSTSNANFACQIYIVGKNGCTVGPLALSSTVLGHARRLLGATSDSGCASGTGSSTVTATGATYQMCGNKNSASSSSLSKITLFVTLFVTLLSLCC